MAVPLMDVRAHRKVIGDEIDARIAAVVEHGKWIMGPEVAEFEKALEDWVGVNGVEAIGCSNGTDALVLAAQALGLPNGHAVICPSFTFIATAEAVAALGGVPVFADVDESSFNLDPESVKAAALAAKAQGLEIAGIIAVDLFGQPADYPLLKEVAADLGCWLLADAAQSFGATQGGQKVGSLADATTTSFFPAKPLGCYGDGGAVFTANPEIANVIRSLRVHGKGSHKYDNVRIGQNSRLDTLQAAILLPKLRILEEEITNRQRVADAYDSLLGHHIDTPQVLDGSASAWAQYTIKVSNRSVIQDRLSNADIGSAIYYGKPMHLQTAYAGYHTHGSELRVSERLAGVVLSLPMHPYLTTEDIEATANAITG